VPAVLNSKPYLPYDEILRVLGFAGIIDDHDVFVAVARGGLPLDDVAETERRSPVASDTADRRGEGVPATVDESTPSLKWCVVTGST
jgi:hypothetical protein